MEKIHVNNEQISAEFWEAFTLLLGGIIGMIIAMGIGRFAYTPILPLMQRDLGMSNVIAGWLASLNYLGYLAGAILCASLPRLIRSHYSAVGYLLLSIMTTVAMGGTESALWWGSLRLVSGIASAVLFIIISAEVAGALLRRGYGHWSGAIYSGVGAGIALSGLAIPLLDKAGRWEGSWIGMGLIGAVLAVVGLLAVRGKMDNNRPLTRSAGRQGDMGRLWPLTVAYFFEGFGYIVTATFIVAIVAKTPGLELYAPYCWVAVGLTAIPSTIFWPYLARRLGCKKTLLAAYLLQASGIIVSIRANTILEIMFSAITFGGTFMGITALTLMEGSSRAGAGGGRATAFLTASFGIGQILGPLFAGFISDQQGGFSIALTLAAISVVIGAVFSVTDRYFDHHQPKGAS